MKTDNKEENTGKVFKIDLFELVFSLEKRKIFIASLTGFITVLSIIYSINIEPTYAAKASLSSPNDGSIIQINSQEYIKETKDSIYSKFMEQLVSRDLQLQVIKDGKYFILSPEIENNNNYFDLIDLDSLLIEPPEQLVSSLIINPYIISVEGNKGSVVSYLNDLIAAADAKTIDNIVLNVEQKIKIRLNQIYLEIELTLNNQKLDRASKIAQISDDSRQEIMEINGEIERARYAAKQKRLNKIEFLNDAATLAGTLGVIGNNIDKLNSNNNNMNLSISFNDSPDKPEWYLYGEKALKERSLLLSNRVSDDPYIPNLITLTNEIKKINSKLEMLKLKKVDFSLSSKLNLLESKKTILEEALIDFGDVSSTNIRKDAYLVNTSKNKRNIVLLTFFGSFIISIFLALVMGVLKQSKSNLMLSTSRH